MYLDSTHQFASSLSLSFLSRVQFVLIVQNSTPAVAGNAREANYEDDGSAKKQPMGFYNCYYTRPDWRALLQRYKDIA